MSAYYASPGGSPAAATAQEELAPVLVAFAGSAPQSRLTVLIRLLMVIPHLIVLWALAIAAYVVVIIGWFGALFTGRLPDFAADYLAGFVRWQTRVFGYAILLTDVYPPFTLDDADYPIRVAVRPGRLNRLAVLFRFILLIPAWIIEAMLSYGAFTLVQIVSWLIVLVTGRMPDSLYQAMAAALRYQVRVIGFTFMLTSTYPWGLYGDLVPAGPTGPVGAQPEYEAQHGFGPQPGDEAQPGFGPQPGDEAQPGYGAQQPAYGAPEPQEPQEAQEAPEPQEPHEAQQAHEAQGAQPGYGDPQGWVTQTPGEPQGWSTQQPGYAQPGYGQQPQPEYAPPPAATGLASWWLVLSSRAKALVTIFLVLGVLFAAAEGALEAAVTSNTVTAAQASSQLQAAAVPVNSVLSSYSAKVDACNGQLSCVTAADRTVSDTYSTFATQVRSISMPNAQTSADAESLASSASHVASIFASLGAATSVTQYQNIANSSGVQQAVSQVSQDYTTLANHLTNS